MISFTLYQFPIIEVNSLSLHYFSITYYFMVVDNLVPKRKLLDEQCTVVFVPRPNQNVNIVMGIFNHP